MASATPLRWLPRAHAGGAHQVHAFRHGLSFNFFGDSFERSKFKYDCVAFIPLTILRAPSMKAFADHLTFEAQPILRFSEQQ
jgi:hypothetical protein